jgi:tetratricopeptide (TPR) repeat protein
MSDGAFSDRLTQLKSRWESDPSSRIFLQLAEEYRHQGRIKEALAVLDRGLKEHPGYLSALVAKGRCHLELGEPESARGVLERVVKQDATQMVAIKLLVRAYLDTGEPEKARERLDLYSLLNDSDPEIEELRRRLRAMEQPPQAPPTSDLPFPEAPRVPPRAAAPPAASGDVFDLGFAPPAAPARRGGDDLFALDVPAARPAPATPPPPPVEATAAAPAVAVAVAEPEEEPEPAGVVFPGLGSRESRSRYLRALAAEGLFAFELTPEAAPPEAALEDTAVAPELAWAAGEAVEVEEERDAKDSRDLEETAPATVAEPLPWIEPEPVWSAPEPAAEAPVFELEETTPWAPEPAPPVEPGPEPAAEPAATATLGEIYLRQGHLGEAKRIFDEVLRREPGNPAAQEGLAQLASRPRESRPLEGRDLLAGYEPGEEGGEVEVRARTAFLLNSYLTRLRQGSQRDVS